MNNYKSVTLEGFQDHLYPESHEKRQLVDAFRSVFYSFGYEETESPILEYYDMFEDAFINKENTFKFFDGKGRIIVLRPDLTMPMARIATTKLKDVPRPLRLSYSGNLYRFIEAYGKSKEIYETGVELIGATGVFADAEVLILAIEALQKSGLTSFQIEIGHADIFHSIIADSNLTGEQISEIQEFIDKKDLMAVQKMVRSDNVQVKNHQLLVELGALYGDHDVLEKARHLAVDHTCKAAISHIENVVELLNQRGYGDYISIDLGFLHHLNYYTGIIFKGITYGVGYPILNGGRYDRLLQKYGQDDPAVGFAINVNELLAAIYSQKIRLKWGEKPAVYFGSDALRIKQLFSIAQRLRQMGWVVCEDLLPGSKAQIYRNAELRRYTNVAYLTVQGTLIWMQKEEATQDIKETEITELNDLEEIFQWNI